MTIRMALRYIAVYDACVLYPAPLRDFLMWIALSDIFSAKWTNKIHDEWIENLLKKRPDLKRKNLERTRLLMNESIPDALVDGYEEIIPKLSLPDENDCHVLAAALKAKKDHSYNKGYVVTFNIKDFPFNSYNI